MKVIDPGFSPTDLDSLAKQRVVPGEVDRVIGASLEHLRTLIPFDLATVFSLEQDRLKARLARGPLADRAVRRHEITFEEFPSLRRILKKGVARPLSASDHRDGDGDPFDGVLDLPDGHGCMVVPLITERRTLGVLTLDRKVCRPYSPDLVALADVFGRLLALALDYAELSLSLDGILTRVNEQNRVLGEQSTAPNDAVSRLEHLPSSSMKHVLHLARQVAPTPTPVLITGETGTGKEVLARAIHGLSPRHSGPFIGLNCAALPAALIESELFGHTKGAFSGASGARAGRFLAAAGGTLLLDEVGELPLEVQPKLLRVLQEGTFEPLGSDKTTRVDVRILAATHVNLRDAVAAGRFREDLYYRLAVFPIHVPPLRERSEDISTLTDTILADLTRRSGRGPFRISPASRRYLATRRWPGNIRELVNTLERALILSEGSELSLGPQRDEIPLVVNERELPLAPITTLRETEKNAILAALTACDGRLYGPDGAAVRLGINPNTLRSRMNRLGLGGARAHHPGKR